MTGQSATTALADLLVGRIGECLRETRAAEAERVYACMLMLWPRGMREPYTHRFAWNDEANVYVGGQDEIERATDRYTLGDWSAEVDLDDARSIGLTEAALSGCGLLPPGPDDESDAAIETVIKMHRAQARFIGDIARRLHSEGVIREIVGYDVLVLCETGSDQDPWTQLTLDVNPPELHGDFLIFHEHEGVHDGETF